MERPVTSARTAANCCLICPLVLMTDRSPLHWAASEGDSVKVLQLLQKKVDVDAVDDVSVVVIVLQRADVLIGGMDTAYDRLFSRTG